MVSLRDVIHAAKAVLQLSKRMKIGSLTLLHEQRNGAQIGEIRAELLRWLSFSPEAIALSATRSSVLLYSLAVFLPFVNLRQEH